ncbi:uncharacterized protein DFL_002493 [Arthrobotrys flagrans]|uniref:Uncharacterized protein n=1 Tax=Arthrobotrys flagrans TaxID=97331 RepID=A0A437AAM3_ARTFL|nr:hypothetical protein DFL_002493 [Arthrobotrys flagrans]
MESILSLDALFECWDLQANGVPTLFQSRIRTKEDFRNPDFEASCQFWNDRCRYAYEFAGGHIDQETHNGAIFAIIRKR